MKYVFVIFLFLLASACRQPVNARTGQLYIYNLSGKYGICDAKKNVVVSPDYLGIAKDDSFFYATKDGSLVDIYSSRGKKLISCNAMNKITDTCLLAFWYTGMKRPDAYKISRLEWMPGGNNEKPRAVIVFKSGRLDTLLGLVTWYQDGHYTNFCMLDSAGYKGLIQLFPRKTLLPFRYKKIVQKSYDQYFLAWNDSTDYSLIDRQGNTHQAPPLVENADDIIFNGNIFTVDSANYRVVYNVKGERLSRFYGMVNRANYYDEGRKVLIYSDTGYRILDSTGALYGNIPLEFNSVKGGVYVTKEGLYSLDKGKYILHTKDTSVRVYFNLSPALHLCSTHKDTLTVYDANGNEIIHVPRIYIGQRDKNNLFKTVERLHFFRNSEQEPFMVYDPSLTKKLSRLFQDVSFSRSEHMFLGKVGGLWGVFQFFPKDKGDDSLAEILPPLFQSIGVDDGSFKTKRKDIVQWFDRSGKLLAGGKPFDFIGGQVSKGMRLACNLDYERVDPYDKYNNSTKRVFTKLMIIDSLGNIKASVPVRAENYPQFQFYNGNRLLYFDKGHCIWHAESGEIIRLDKFSFKELVNLNDEPFALICEDENGNEGVYSLKSEKIVIPFGKISQITYQPYSRTAIAFYTNPYTDPRILAILDENGNVY